MHLIAHLFGQLHQDGLPQGLFPNRRFWDATLVLSAQGAPYCLGDREQRQQSYDVSESLMKRRLVRQAWGVEARAEPVKDGVCGLVGDDVVGQARVDGLPSSPGEI